MRSVYVLYGSEDGLLGVYGSEKRAVQAAYDYVGEGAQIGHTSEYYTSIEGEFTVDLYKEYLQ